MMSIPLAVIWGVILIGIGIWIYSSKILTPASEREIEKTKALIRSLLPGVRIHAIDSPRHVHLTFEGSEYMVAGPHWKDFEDGGPKTSVVSIDANRRVKIVWQRFHVDTKELNAQHLKEALEIIKKETVPSADGGQSSVASTFPT